MSTYPRVETPHKQDDGSYVVRVHASASKVTEYPAKDLKTARQVCKLIESVVTAIVADEPAPKKSERNGRPTLLTPDLQKVICKCLREGQMTWARVAEAVNVGERTLMRWLEDGERALERLEREGDAYEETARDALYRVFWQDCKRARADFQRDLLGRIKIAGAREWQANAWLLERIWHKEFSRRQVMISQNDQPLTVVFRRPELADLQSETLDPPSASADEVDLKPKPGNGNGH